MIGLGLSRFAGIACALILSADVGALNWLQDLAFAWSLMTSFLLGSLVALLPLLIYEWSHDLQAEYSDE